jgi:hypothetical protein
MECQDILQSCPDVFSVLTYALADEQALKKVIHGGSHAAVSLPPSWLFILTDGRDDKQIHPVDAKHMKNDGCIISVRFRDY